jgi:hypothetical protein
MDQLNAILNGFQQRIIEFNSARIAETILCNQSVFIIFQLNNIWNKFYAPNGYTYAYKYGGELVRNNFYYPMAERNLMIGLNLNF